MLICGELYFELIAPFINDLSNSYHPICTNLENYNHKEKITQKTVVVFVAVKVRLVRSN